MANERAMPPEMRALIAEAYDRLTEACELLAAFERIEAMAWTGPYGERLGGGCHTVLLVMVG
jgi:hypothetical protein